ncbi:hypothetical protein HQQ80_16430 [Microbacteriaceae bacterium VKM Ac-2855]|nr:hypothetical protein [Microbacteriaceae bacterium VKM Ac-2855]
MDTEPLPERERDVMAYLKGWAPNPGDSAEPIPPTVSDPTPAVEPDRPALPPTPDVRPDLRPRRAARAEVAVPAETRYVQNARRVIVAVVVVLMAVIAFTLARAETSPGTGERTVAIPVSSPALEPSSEVPVPPDADPAPAADSAVVVGLDRDAVFEPGSPFLRLISSADWAVDADDARTLRQTTSGCALRTTRMSLEPDAQTRHDDVATTEAIDAVAARYRAEVVTPLEPVAIGGVAFAVTRLEEVDVPSASVPSSVVVIARGMPGAATRLVAELVCPTEASGQESTSIAGAAASLQLGTV